MKFFFFEILKSITAHSRSLIFFFLLPSRKSLNDDDNTNGWTLVSYQAKKKRRDNFFFSSSSSEIYYRDWWHFDSMLSSSSSSSSWLFFFRIFFSLEKFTHNISLGFQRFFFFFSWLVSRRKHTHITHEMRKISKFSIFFSKMKSCSVFDLDLFTFPWQKKKTAMILFTYTLQSFQPTEKKVKKILCSSFSSACVCVFEMFQMFFRDCWCWIAS